MISWMITHLRESITPERRVRGAMWTLLFCIVAWPLSSLTIFIHATPEQQGILALSWLALIGETVILIITTDIRQEQENGES